MKPVIFGLLLLAALSAAPGDRKFTGVITDSMCSSADHKGMRMGPTDAECTIACEVYTLSDQQTPERFAGKKVTVTGTLDAKTKTIRVASITAAK
jgi:hypothetical protein